MKKSMFLLIATFAIKTSIAQEVWKPINEGSAANKNLFSTRKKPDRYKLFQLNDNEIKAQLQKSPSERTTKAAQSDFIVSIPNEEGKIEHFKTVETYNMDPQLAAKYPEIKSYAGKGIEDPTASIHFSYAPDGFHAMIVSAKRNTVYIDPIDQEKAQYIVISRQDVYDDHLSFNCGTVGIADQVDLSSQVARAADDGTLRTYRLALASTGEYSKHFLNGTETTDAQRKGKVLSSMNTLVGRINQIYERDFGVRMVLVANNDLLIYLDAATDPWSNEFNATTQTTINKVIGLTNYDIGHLVTKKDNDGDAGCIGCVCLSSKGSAFTSYTNPTGDNFIVDYVAHEMGHQFGANHTHTYRYEIGFAQIEPGSGSTIMGYAGITGSSTDIQMHSDDYFNAFNVQQVTDYVKAGGCGTSALTGNKTPTVNAGSDYTIPKLTPFVLTAHGKDDDNADVLTYTWEQMDEGGETTTIPDTAATSGPNFRSRIYNIDSTRTFPELNSILDGTNLNRWEALPSVARTLHFKTLVRDNHIGGGNTKDDDMILTVDANSGPFKVTAPNTAVSLTSGASFTVKWNVNKTNLQPVNCAEVKISLSIDGGKTFPIVLANNTPNDGAEAIIVPNNIESTCRVKIEAIGNIFFDICDTDFSIIPATVSCGIPSGLASASITNSGATVSWTSVSGAISYDVDYKLSSSSTWTNAATSITTTSQSINGLITASAYDFRVRANCKSASSSYAEAQFSTTSDVTNNCTNAFEKNETLTTAASITLGAANSAAISSTSDLDYYKFTTTSVGDITVKLAGPASVDYDLFVYNNSGTEIGKSEGSTATETVTLNNSAAGTYSILVKGYKQANSQTCYTLTASLSNGTAPAIAALSSAKTSLSTNSEENNNLLLFPNPASTSIQVDLSNSTNIATLRVFDLYGKIIVQQTAVEGTNKIDVSNLSSGIYFTSAISNDGKVVLKGKFVKD